MILALTIALGAIALGTALGLLPGASPRSAGPMRNFAMVTAIAVVLGQLLPQSLAAIGLWALLVFVLGYVAPQLAERAATALRKPACSHDDAMCTDLGLELGYIGLLLHSVGDGVGLGLYTGPLHADHEHYDVLLTIGGHTVPVAALVAIAFKTHRGARSAAWRAVGVALATVLGLASANAFEPTHLQRYEPWMTAAVSGLLLHIVAHGWPAEPHPTMRSRLLDFAAIALGLLLVSFGGHSHEGESNLGDLRAAMGHALVELTLETAPMLLLGLVIAAFLQTRGDRLPLRLIGSGGSRVSQALRGALTGIPLPVCACGILPVAHGLRARGGAAAFVVAFLLATPELGVDTVALSARFLGWPLTLARLFGALAISVVAGYVLSRAVADSGLDSRSPALAGQLTDSRPPNAHGARSGLLERMAGHFEELLYHVGAWTVVGLLAAAYLQATASADSLAVLSGTGLDLLVVTLIAVPSYVCAASATPLAAVLLAKGVSQGAVLTGLLLGPATNLATLGWLKRAYGTRATALSIGSVLIVTWALAFGVNAALPAPALLDLSLAAEHSHGLFSYASAALLGLLLLRAMWRYGLRAWLGSLGDSLAHGDHGHAHDHSHAHEGHAHAHSPAPAAQ